MNDAKRRSKYKESLKRLALSVASLRLYLLPAMVRLATGMILGAFASRILAEHPISLFLPENGTPTSFAALNGAFSPPQSYSARHSPHWGPTLALTLAVGLAFVAVYAFTELIRARGRVTVQSAGQTTRNLDWMAQVHLVPYLLLILYLVQPTPNLLQAGVLFGGALVLSLLLSGLPGLEPEWTIDVLLFLLALIAYLNTLMPAVGTRDGYELQAISATLGFAHPTGYPLFPILGRLWIALFQFGSIAWRINVLCALFAAASVPLVYRTARRILDRPTSVWSALLFAFSQTLWAQASQPEKYTLNALFVALVLYVAFGTDSREPGTESKQRAPHPHLRWLGFVYGLSLTHHRTMLMLAPALALYLFWRDPGLLKRPAALRKEWLPALGIALAPLLIYLYIPWRAYAQGWAMTLPEFLDYISGAYYGPAVHLMDWASKERSLMFWRFLVAQFGYPGIVLGALGLVGLALRRKWQFLICTALAYATYYVWGTVWYAYYNDVNSFIPNHMILSIWIGSGAATAWAAIKSVRTKIRGLSAESGNAGTIRPLGAHPGTILFRGIFWSLAALMPMSMIWINGPLVNQSDKWAMTRWGEQAITRGVTPPLQVAANATILADREKYPALDYVARVEKRRPDVDVVILGNEQAYLDRLAWDLAQGVPVYLARFLPGLEGPYHLSSTGPLVRVSTTPLTKVDQLEGIPAILNTADGTPIELLGFYIHKGPETERDLPDDSAELRLAAGESLPITLFWRSRAPVPANYYVALRLVSAAGRPWWTSRDHPVSGMYPTAAWKPDEIVVDWHEAPIDKIIPPGTYTLQTSLRPALGRDRAETNGQESEWATLTTIAVTSPLANPTPSRRLRAVAPGRVQLLGYDLPEKAPPTGRVPLRLYWQSLAMETSEQALRALVEIGTRVTTTSPHLQGTSIAPEWRWTVPGKGEYPTSLWARGATIVTEHLLTMPPEEGQATVQIAMREDELVSFYPRWLAPRTTTVSLPPIQIVGRPPTAPGATNYGDLILLLGDDLGQRTLPPGAPLELVLRWQGLQAMEANYTLFVQVLAPDGTLKGQIDVWPRDGTHPTSQWRPGETFEDRYLLYIDPDAPPGDYQVAIGWYLLETMQRLPVLDAAGEEIDDKVLLSGLTVK